MSVVDIQEGFAKIKADGPSAPRLARDPVNQAMINNWVEAMGDRNPIYVDEEAAKAPGIPESSHPPPWRRYGPWPGCTESAPGMTRWDG
ncbi:putative nucleic-acid-binding protein [Mycobacteroides abscessus]|nr:putative nucleic-acid-binding protein [Mycobacteroides abscessus]